MISTQAGTPNFGDRDRVLFYVSFGREPSDAPPRIDPAVAARFGDADRRYLEKHGRAALGFQGTPIRLVFRARSRRDT